MIVRVNSKYTPWSITDVEETTDNCIVCCFPSSLSLDLWDTGPQFLRTLKNPPQSTIVTFYNIRGTEEL